MFPNDYFPWLSNETLPQEAKLTKRHGCGERFSSQLRDGSANFLLVTPAKSNTETKPAGSFCICRLADGESPTVEVIAWQSNDLLQQWRRQDRGCVFVALGWDGTLADDIADVTFKWQHLHPSDLPSLNAFMCVTEKDRWPDLSIFSLSSLSPIVITLFSSILLFCILTVHAVLTPRTSSTVYQSNNKPPTHSSHYRPLATTHIVRILKVGPDGLAQLV